MCNSDTSYVCPSQCKPPSGHSTSAPPVALLRPPTVDTPKGATIGRFGLPRTCRKGKRVASSGFWAHSARVSSAPRMSQLRRSGRFGGQVAAAQPRSVRGVRTRRCFRPGAQEHGRRSLCGRAHPRLLGAGPRRPAARGPRVQLSARSQVGSQSGCASGVPARGELVRSPGVPHGVSAYHPAVLQARRFPPRA